jgi:hypothetical protein
MAAIIRSFTPDAATPLAKPKLHTNTNKHRNIFWLRLKKWKTRRDQSRADAPSPARLKNTSQAIFNQHPNGRQSNKGREASKSRSNHVERMLLVSAVATGPPPQPITRRQKNEPR